MPIDPTPGFDAPAVVRRDRTRADRGAPLRRGPTRRVFGRRVDAAAAVVRAVAAGSAPLRRALLRRAAALGVACTVLVLGGRQLSAADRDRSTWGETTRVLVLNRDIDAGGLVEPADLVWQRWPVALVPADAVRVAPTEARRAGTGLARGEVMLNKRWADGRRGAWAVELGENETAVQVTLEQSLEGVAPGDQVDVVAATDTFVAMAGSGSDADDQYGTSIDTPLGSAGAAVVAAAARVLRVEGSSVVLAVGRADATATAAAAISGTVTLVVHP